MLPEAVRAGRGGGMSAGDAAAMGGLGVRHADRTSSLSCYVLYVCLTTGNLSTQTCLAFAPSMQVGKGGGRVDARDAGRGEILCAVFGAATLRRSGQTQGCLPSRVRSSPAQAPRFHRTACAGPMPPLPSESTTAAPPTPAQHETLQLPASPLTHRPPASTSPTMLMPSRPRTLTWPWPKSRG